MQSCGNEGQNASSSEGSEPEKQTGQSTTGNELSQNAMKRNKPQDFIPEGYVLHTYEGGSFAEGWEEIQGDLNKDGLEDVVLIIKGTDPDKIVDDEYQGKLDRNRRGILVLLNKGGHYELATKNYDCFSSENEDGGVYYAPELSVFIDKGNLHLEYGHGRYGSWGYTFRYQDGDLALIGYDLYVSQGPVPQYEVSINFLNKKKLTRDNLNKEDDGENYDVKYKDTWENFTLKKLMKLSEIEDFDKLSFSE